MVDLSNSIAKKTVHFGRSLRGQELIDAVGAQWRPLTSGDVVRRRRALPDSQRSAYPYENLLVTPSKTSAFVDPEETYDSAVIARHDALSPGEGFSAGYSQRSEVQAVLDSAGKLPRFLPGGRAGTGWPRGLPRPTCPCGRSHTPGRRTADSSGTWQFCGGRKTDM